MSIDYCLRVNATMSELFNGCLNPYGITEYVDDETSDTARCLTDGFGKVWVYAVKDPKTKCVQLHTYLEAPEIIMRVKDLFTYEVFDEFSAQYMGFENEDEADQFFSSLTNDFD